MVSDKLNSDSTPKREGFGVEIKLAIKGDDFKVVTMMFVNYRDFTTLVKRTKIQ